MNRVVSWIKRTDRAVALIHAWYVVLVIVVLLVIVIDPFGNILVQGLCSARFHLFPPHKKFIQSDADKYRRANDNILQLARNLQDVHKVAQHV